jgi:hypothetical protein
VAGDCNVLERLFGSHSHKDGQRYCLGDSLLAALMIIDLSGPDLGDPEAVRKVVLPAVQKWKEYKKRCPSRSSAGIARPNSRKASSNSSVYSQLSGLDGVIFNDFLEDKVIWGSMMGQRDLHFQILFLLRRRRRLLKERHKSVLNLMKWGAMCVKLGWLLKLCLRMLLLRR